MTEESEQPSMIFDWCKECTCYKSCYWHTDGRLSKTPLCIDPDCAEGPAR